MARHSADGPRISRRALLQRVGALGLTNTVCTGPTPRVELPREVLVETDASDKIICREATSSELAADAVANVRRTGGVDHLDRL